MRYFSITELTTRDLPRTEQRFTEQIPGVPLQLAQGSEWRQVNETNLDWLDAVLAKAMLGAVDDEERLGMAVLFRDHLRGWDLRPELFEGVSEF